jgi:hypothetical protein
MRGLRFSGSWHVLLGYPWVQAETLLGRVLFHTTPVRGQPTLALLGLHGGEPKTGI